MGVAERRLRERARRREDILDAAERVFAERGVGPATMEDVAAAAEIGKGTLYLYFESKDALFGAVAGRALAAIRCRVEAALPGARTGLDGVRVLLDSYLAHATDAPWKMRVLLSSFERGAIVDVQAPALASYRESLGALRCLAAEQLRRGQADGSIRPELDPELAWVQVWAHTLGLLVLLGHREEVERRVGLPLPADTFLENHVDFQLRALASSARPADPGDRA